METVTPRIANQIYLDGMPLVTYQYATLFMSILVSALLVGVAFLLTRRLRAVPGRGQALLELIVVAFRNLVYSTMGPKDGRKYLPLIGTIFLYIWTCNMIGIIPLADVFHTLTGDTSVYFSVWGHTIEIPGFAEPTRNVNTPWALGIMTFFIMHTAAIARKGPAKYFDEYFTPHFGSFTWPLQNGFWRLVAAGVLAAVWGTLAWIIGSLAGARDSLFPHVLAGYKVTWCTIIAALVALVAFIWCMVRLSHEPRKVGIPNLLMFPLNVIGKFAEILSMSFRLFGNIFGGAIIIALLGGMVHQVALPILLQMFMGIFTGTIQAFVFSMLALTYITVEIQQEEESAEESAVQESAAA
jgi:F0F1-type ATP synthase membrane subunit a